MESKVYLEGLVLERDRLVFIKFKIFTIQIKFSIDCL